MHNEHCLEYYKELHYQKTLAILLFTAHHVLVTYQLCRGLFISIIPFLFLWKGSWACWKHWVSLVNMYVVLRVYSENGLEWEENLDALASEIDNLYLGFYFVLYSTIIQMEVFVLYLLL